MFETPITVTGRVVTDVATRVTAAGDKVANFRILCQERRYDREQETWVDGDRLYMRVTGWRKLAEGLGALEKGDQVVVSGRLKVHEYTAADGTLRAGPEIDARAVGPDLAWHTVIVNRRAWASADQLALVGPTGQPETPEEEVADAA
ncbi:single-stranded DNA-binding protein [Actinophytocola algeriensis]|jgi:single-strand DNA-binding protein|uniref:Single-strand DNA-binding protein n=1 Tax=Actinophytocola algeriensis TaxID=1768010 RepID=A0A7W7Q0E5_9PSEU|nr:single-stranded DNA-binding protein [Actinophytocola algeriensis]MBB4904579.1 single-strand DNA-binding protein [Actinophytocola algeriensis]MBE1476562.1 single-strand DNA-binding protein [Actinophytocola algeriensis]